MVFREPIDLSGCIRDPFDISNSILSNGKFRSLSKYNLIFCYSQSGLEQLVLPWTME